MFKNYKKLPDKIIELLPFNSIYWIENKHSVEISRSRIVQNCIFHKSQNNYRKHFYKPNIKDY
jgi:hypothetical protein